MKIQGIVHIFFDLDDTLWDLRKNSREGMMKTLEIIGLTLPDTEAFLEAYMHYNKIAWEAYYRNTFSQNDLRKERFRWTLEHFGIFDSNLVERLSETYMKITPTGPYLVEGCLQTLNALKNHSRFRLHVLTNGFPDVQPVKLKASGIRRYFENVFISDEIGYRKPQIEIFQYAASAVNARPEECLMVGDQFESDVKGATQSGWKAVWFNPNCSKRYTYPYTLNTLNDLPMLLL